MERLRKAALLTRLVQKLHEHGSWCGETHIQKATYFLQTLTGVPLEFDFILYKHGPFSFDLRDELTALRADALLGLEARRPYGAQIVSTEQSDYIQNHYPKTLAKYEDRIEFVAQQLGSRGVVELERLATALYVKETLGENASKEERAEKLTTLKPHIPKENAQTAVEEVDQITEAADYSSNLAVTAPG